MKKIYLDVESTGLSKDKHDIHQLAYIIEIDDEVKEEGEFKIRPSNFDTISPKALEIANVTIDQLKEYPEPQIVYDILICMLDKYVDKYNKEDKFTIAGQNVQFDIKFLNEFFIRNDNKYFYSYFDRFNVIDSLPMARKLTNEGCLDVPNHQLGTLCKHFGIELQAHDAVEDIRATKKLISELGNLKLKRFKEAYNDRLWKEFSSCDINPSEELIDNILKMFYEEFGEK